MINIYNILEANSRSSYYADKIGVTNPSINMTTRSSILSMKKSRNMNEKQNTSAMSASASRRRSRIENDLNYNSTNMRSFDLLPQKGPIKVLRKISMASCSPKSYCFKLLILLGRKDKPLA